MATANPDLIAAIEKTTLNLSKGSPYQWGHMGSCNCGNLAQELTKLSKAEIHSYAMQRLEIGMIKYWNSAQAAVSDGSNDSKNGRRRTYS